jgi:hypothetical protein
VGERTGWDEGARGSARADVAELMRRLSEGDTGALLELHDRHGSRIVGALRSMLRRRGVEWLERDDLDGLLVDACLALVDVAGRWDPAGGALPWVWARHRLEAVVDRHVGQHADELDAERSATLERLDAGAPAPPCDEPDLLDLLESLTAGAGGQAALVREALSRAGTVRDQRLLLEVRVQESLGDRSPAATVAPRFDMQPAAVRQQVGRVKRRLRELAASDPRYAGLADLPLVA